MSTSIGKLCIFTAPKPFRDAHISTIQRNAIRSWSAMSPDVEVFLVGDEEGIAEAARELGVRHLAGVATNQKGTPLISAIFAAARAASAAPLLAYVNADIILFPETLAIAQKVAASQPDFVLLGRRYDLAVTEPLDFKGDWPSRLRAQIASAGVQHPFGGSDYFIFPRHLYTELPDFAVGRAGWDNWMIYHARTQGWQPIDASRDLLILHQNHDYAHLNSPRGHQRHDESDANTALGGGLRHMHILLDVDRQLVDGRVRRAPWSAVRALRAIERWLQPDAEGAGLRWALLRRVRRLRRSLSGVN
jgi:hypothetical protein